MSKYVVSFFITLLLALGLAGCHKAKENDVIRVGVIASPESRLMEVASQVAKERYGLTVKVITFTDYVMPNEALSTGSIDANMFQHVPYLEAQIKNKDYKISVLGNGFVYPIGVYSKKLKDLETLPVKGTVAIPNDPSNEARALLLLQKFGLITLKSGVTSTATLDDIASNPKQIKFIELDAAQLPRSLEDVDAAVINNTFASAAGMAINNALFREGADSLYVNVMVVRTEDLNNPQLKQLMAAFQSQPVIDEAKTIFGESGAIPSFTPTQPNEKT